MRWKIVIAAILFLILAVTSVVGWIQWQEKKQAKNLEEKIAICMNQIRQGEAKKAQENLENIIADHPRLKNADDIYAILAESYESTGQNQKARDAWAKIREQFPNSKHMPKALIDSAQALRSQGNNKEAAALYDKIIAQYMADPASAKAYAGKAQLLLDAEDLAAAKALALKALNQFPDSPAKGEIETIIGKINSELLYGGAQMEGTEIYTIAKGDKLETLGRKFNVSPDLIKRVNRIRDSRSLRVGRRIKIPKTNFSMVVNKSDNTLTLYNNKEFFKKYTIRTGKEDYLTPIGDFAIESKVINPPWNNPETGERIPALDPRNELGTRWMAFNGSIGIHGTIHPETIGKYASNGCVGMTKEDVEELYDLVPLYTPIKVIGKMQTSAKTIQ